MNDIKSLVEDLEMAAYAEGSVLASNDATLSAERQAVENTAKAREALLAAVMPPTAPDLSALRSAVSRLDASHLDTALTDVIREARALVDTTPAEPAPVCDCGGFLLHLESCSLAKKDK